MLFHDQPERVVAIYAHPDDPEVSCAGALARWASGGAECHVVVANTGDKGSFDPAADPSVLAEQRAEEAKAAAGVLGVASVTFLGVPDGELENTAQLRGTLVATLRGRRPDVVVAPDPTAVFFGRGYVNHHDHRALGWAVLDACAPMAASPLYFPEAGPAHRVATVLLSGTLEPDTWVDIGEWLGTKADALRCHASQLADPEVVDEVVRSRAVEAGHAAGVTHAEGFRRLALG